MREISEAIAEIRSEIPTDVTLVAVSKFHLPERIKEAYDFGQRVFGENRPQEMTKKQQLLPKDIQWHMIGHLQTNKVKMIAPYVSMIESVDSEKLLGEIDRQAATFERRIPVLLEIRVAAEETKSGFTPSECHEFFENGRYKTFNNVEFSGLMCMASHTDDERRIREDFKKVHELFDMLKSEFFADDEKFRYRSWGMSDDYRIAIEEGSNIVRIGTKIFGERDYSKPFNV